MWIMTTIGFFSICEKEWDRKANTLTVRGRSRKDLERFRGRIEREARYRWRQDLDIEIEEDFTADYYCRFRAPKSLVATTMTDLMLTIDYDKFKPAVGEAGLPVHERVYNRCWGELCEIQEAETGRGAYDGPLMHLRYNKNTTADVVGVSDLMGEWPVLTGDHAQDTEVEGLDDDLFDRNESAIDNEEVA